MIGVFHKWAFKASLKKEIEWKVGKERMKYWERRINRPEYEMMWEHIYQKSLETGVSDASALLVFCRDLAIETFDEMAG